jgi:heterodisulfide reductase subunit C
MGRLYDVLNKDIRFNEGLKACINCGTCTAICPAAEFYNYDPRILATTLQSRDEEQIEALLKSDFIWYCGECMSCKTRCPRGNVPGLLISVVRSVSQDLGYFVESEKGRQQLALKRTIGEWILNTGYCLYPKEIELESHPEQGPVWGWITDNLKEVLARFDAHYQEEGPGIFRKIPQESLDELKRIFDVTGGTERFEKLEEFSGKKAAEMNKEFSPGQKSEYYLHVYNFNNNKHGKDEH